MDPRGRFPAAADRGEIRHAHGGGGGANAGVSSVRILLVGLSAMLSEIVSAAIAAEPTMRVVAGAPSMAELDDLARRRRIDAVIFASGNRDFQDDRIAGLLRANPRLCLLAVDGRDDRAIVHFLTPSRTVVPGLEAATLTAAIQAGTWLRLG
jgi:hypothetical protein